MRLHRFLAGRPPARPNPEPEGLDARTEVAFGWSRIDGDQSRDFLEPKAQRVLWGGPRSEAWARGEPPWSAGVERVVAMLRDPGDQYIEGMCLVRIPTDTPIATWADVGREPRRVVLLSLARVGLTEWCVSGSLAGLLLPKLRERLLLGGDLLLAQRPEAAEAVAWVQRDAMGRLRADPSRVAFVEQCLIDDGVLDPALTDNEKTYSMLSLDYDVQQCARFWERCQTHDMVPMDQSVPLWDAENERADLFTLATLVAVWPQYVRAEALWRELCARAAPWGLEVQEGVALDVSLYHRGDGYLPELEQAVLDAMAGLIERNSRDPQHRPAAWTRFVQEGGVHPAEFTPLGLRALRAAALASRLGDLGPGGYGAVRMRPDPTPPGPQRTPAGLIGRRTADLPNPAGPLWDLWRLGFIPRLGNNNTLRLSVGPWWPDDGDEAADD